MSKDNKTGYVSFICIVVYPACFLYRHTRPPHPLRLYLTVLCLCGNLRAVTLGAALAPLAALGGDWRVGLQLLGVLGSTWRGRGGGRAASREGAQLRVLVRGPVPHPVGLEGMCVWHVRVMRTVCVRRPRVCMVLGSVAQLAAGLCPTWLAVVQGRGSGCWLSWREAKAQTQVTLNWIVHSGVNACFQYLHRCISQKWLCFQSDNNGFNVRVAN